MSRSVFPAVLTVAVIGIAAPAKAHFLWLVPDSASKPALVRVYFSETAEPDDPSLLSRLKGLKLRHDRPDNTRELTLALGSDALIATMAGDYRSGSYGLNYTYGVRSREGEEAFLLVYHARMYPPQPANRWSTADAEHRERLELVPVWDKGRLTLRVLWDGKPLPKVEVLGGHISKDPVESSADDQGALAHDAAKPGLYAFRAKHVEPIAGRRDGKKYSTVRHYATLVVAVEGDGPSRPAGPKTATSKARRATKKVVARKIPTGKAPAGDALAELPFGLTSFGAAIVDRSIYVCGGHVGPAHEYDARSESDQFLRLNLHSPNQWEKAGTVPRRAGLALVSYGGKVYRIGGFEARNKKGEAANLRSTNDFSRFDPAKRTWESLTPLPAGRSSHDAIVVGKRLYVIGGWELRGSEPVVWHDSALQLDLVSAGAIWEELPKPPFGRRALAVGEHDGKLYVLGGMQEKGGPTTTTYVLDLEHGSWSEGPKLPGDGLQGFGGAAATCGGRLYATTYSGKLWYLSSDGKEWKPAGQLSRPRFFHRLLCVGGKSLVAVGGGNMEQGKERSLELIPAVAAH